MKTLECDVTLVGAGLVGLTLAKVLSNLGLSVILLERRAKSDDFKMPPVFQQRAIVLTETSIDYLTQVGFDLSAAETIHTVHVSEKGSLGKIRFHASRVNMPYLARVMKAFELVHSMYEVTLASEHVQEYNGVEIESVDEKNSELVFKSNQDTFQLKSQFIIACDGAKSTILQQLTIPQKENDYQQTAVIANLKISGAHNHIAYERFLPEGPLAFLPVAKDEVAMVWCMGQRQAEKILALETEAFYDKLYQVFGHRMGYFTDISQRHGHPLKSMQALECRRGKVLIMGNAAHSLHPVAGQGFNLSVRDIAALENIIKLQVEEGIDPEILFKKYLDMMQKGQHTMGVISDILPRIFTERYRAFKPLRSMAMTVCDSLPFINKRLTEKFLGLRDHAAL